MATLKDSRILFITTSPRSPEKMIPEIILLNEHFHGQPWDTRTQKAFAQLLKEHDFFNGTSSNDPAFSARDRINRAPKALGFVVLSPTIALTPAGEALIHATRTEEIFLRQLLKFQLPSPYHKAAGSAAHFWGKPYLEIFRLIRHFGSLHFDELQLFGLQLTDYHRFDAIVSKINTFRSAKAQSNIPYPLFKRTHLLNELQEIYQDDIASGNTKTRESRDTSTSAFLRTKGNNMHDYTDACIRYLRATGMVHISHTGNTLSIATSKMPEIDYILAHTDRDPAHVDDERQYVAYLGDPSLPLLQTDDKALLLAKLSHEFPSASISAAMTLPQLKDILASLLQQRKEDEMAKQTAIIKRCEKYDDIQSLFHQIRTDRNLYDAPLMLEWNTWRAMTMLNGGTIKANLKFDDYGQPMNTAQGNMADIVCDYGSFALSVEVTMAAGQRQYEMEGEPVSRHLGQLKKALNKPTYCLFIAPHINEACIAHFFVLHKLDITLYGGASTIIPLDLPIFQKMVEDSRNSTYRPEPKQVRHLFERSIEIARQCSNEKAWYEQIQTEALHWLSTPNASAESPESPIH